MKFFFTLHEVRIICILLLILSTSFSHKSPLNDYEREFRVLIAVFGDGLKSEGEFSLFLDDMLELKDNVGKAVKNKEDDYTQLESLHNNIEAVYAFIGEISPNGSNFSLSHSKKQRALNILGLTESWYNEHDYCVAITKIELWNGKYVSYLMINPSNCIWRYECNITREGGTNTNSGGISGRCSRGLFKSFTSKPIKIDKLICTPTPYCK